MFASRLDEVMVSVVDADKVSRWYDQALDLTPLIGGSDAVPIHEGTVLTKRGGPVRPRIRLVPGAGPARRAAGDMETVGPLGVGFTTDDIHKAAARLGALGAEPISEPLCLERGDDAEGGPTRWEVFMRLDGGEVIVLIQRENVPYTYGTVSGEARVSEPLHVSIWVQDLLAAEAFFSDVLQQVPIVREHCMGTRFERLMGLAPGEEFDFVMMKSPTTSTGRVVLMQRTESVREPTWPVGDGSPREAAFARTGLAAIGFSVTDVADCLLAAENYERDHSLAQVVMGNPPANPAVTLLDGGFGCPIYVWQERDHRGRVA